MSAGAHRSAMSCSPAACRAVAAIQRITQRRRPRRLLCPGAGARQEAGAHGRRCDHHRGQRGGRPYRAGLDRRCWRRRSCRISARCRYSSPAASGAARRCWPISRWAPPGVQLGTRFVCAHESIAHPRFKQAFIRASARDAVPSVQLDPALSGDPGARARQSGDRAISRSAARGHRPVRTAASCRKRTRSSRSSISGPARCAGR